MPNPSEMQVIPATGTGDQSAAIHHAATVVPDAVEAPVVKQDDPNAALKQRVRDALAAQPFRVNPSFEDLLAVADALIDA